MSNLTFFAVLAAGLALGLIIGKNRGFKQGLESGIRIGRIQMLDEQLGKNEEVK
jgi:hypothetical protein